MHYPETIEDVFIALGIAILMTIISKLFKKITGRDLLGRFLEKYFRTK